MLYIERREKILEMLRKSGNVKVSDLVDIFHVDATTIRRDLKALADNEKVKMVYGGAYYINEMSQWPIEDNPDVKRTINIEKKQIVAQKAAKEIKDGDTIILNNGVTAELILDYLPEMKSESDYTIFNYCTESGREAVYRCISSRWKIQKEVRNVLW